MNPQQILEQMGYQAHEARVYLAALELGESTITDLARRTEIPRTTVAEIVEHMHKKGLLGSYIKRIHRYWVPENPEKLLAHLKENEQAFAKLLPELQALRRGDNRRPVIETFAGLTQIKQIMDDMLFSKHNISALISWEDWIKQFGYDYVEDYIERRVRKFLKIRVISPRTATAIKLKQTDAQELRHTKFLPPGYDLRRITNFIYGDKLAIISLNRTEPIGLLINDPDATYANQLYFESLWQNSSEN